MRTEMLIQRLRAGNMSKTVTTAHGHQVVRDHIEALKDRFQRSSGPDRDRLRHECNNLIYEASKAGVIKTF